MPSSDSPPPALRQHLLVYLSVYLLWLLLAERIDGQELLAGALAALVVTIASAPYAGLFSALRLTPAAPLHLLRYLGYFFAALIRANLDVARRVLSPTLPIRPALVEVQTRLVSPLGRMLLANSITLTPGTLSVDIDDDRILVHWIDCPPGADLETATQRIAAGFERHILGFLE
ncbi:MAG TPA: cation transporter [Sedimenticola thiotaurini]|uniref:Cation transporter n=1 Tax=Sedimenticola thiotaurini TaxID=1543721 RepID=A0A831W5C5_9GAMM|nr:cation transporter [Sedimenticola thiotaurini]